MNRRAFLATVLVAPAIPAVPAARLAYEAPKLTRLPFKLPKATGPFRPPPLADFWGLAT